MSLNPIVHNTKNIYRILNVVKNVVARKGNLAPILKIGFFAKSEIRDDASHLKDALAWLQKTQTVVDGGSSAMFDLKTGWKKSYPETSGYIVSTYLSFWEMTSDERFKKLAIELADWEIDIHAPNGGVRSNMESDQTRIFNTGQVMLGWLDLYERFKDEKYLTHSLKAGDYALNLQEEDGSWVKDTYGGPRTYQARTDWALIKLSRLSGNTKYEAAARKNLNWIASNRNKVGWYDSCGFLADLPITHVIDYTLRGLYECAIELKDAALMKDVELSMDHLLTAIENQSVHNIPYMIPQKFDDAWKGDLSTSCLTGNAQLAYLYMAMGHHLNKKYYIEAGNKILETLKSVQIFDSNDENVHGAVPGCFPFYYGYCQGTFPNWATKFYADALMMKISNNTHFSVRA